MIGCYNQCQDCIRKHKDFCAHTQRMIEYNRDTSECKGYVSVESCFTCTDYAVNHADGGNGSVNKWEVCHHYPDQDRPAEFPAKYRLDCFEQKYDK